MTMKNIRDKHHVPAYQGRRVRYQGRLATITQSRSVDRLGIRLDGENHSRYVHPADKDIKYIEA